MIRFDQLRSMLGEVDALADDGESQRAQEDAEDGAEAAGQQHPSDDHRDDRVEDVAHPARDLGRIELDRLAHADERGAQADRTKSAIVIRFVGMPALRALSLSPPMAKIQLP